MKIINRTILGIGVFTWITLLIFIVIYFGTAIFNGHLPNYGDTEPGYVRFLGPVFGFTLVITVFMFPVQIILLLICLTKDYKLIWKNIIIKYGAYLLIFLGILIVTIFDPVGLKDWFLD